MTTEYDDWKNDPTPENLSKVLKSVDPVLVSESQRYSGPKPILYTRAKTLAVDAIKKFDPTQGAKLNSWIVTQLQPLSRYSNNLKPVKAPEVVIRQAAEVNRVRKELSDRLSREPDYEELSDEMGISPKRIKRIESAVRPVLATSQLTAQTDEGVEELSPAVSISSPMSYAADIVYNSLDARERAIYDWKTGLHGREQLSNEDIAKRLGLTPPMISQITSNISKQLVEAGHGV